MSERVTKLLEELRDEKSTETRMLIMADILGELGLIGDEPHSKWLWREAITK
jgi:hypothetical protein